MHRLAMFAAVLLLSASSALADWPLEPKDFRGVPFPGASKAEVAKKLGFRDGIGDLRTVDLKQGFCTDVLCSDPGFALAGVAMPTAFSFKDDRLVQIFVSFSSASYGTVKEIVIERYGPPTKVERAPVRTKAGVEYENETALWTGNAVEIKLSRFGINIDQSQWWLSDRALIAEQEKAAEEAKKKAATSF